MRLTTKATLWTLSLVLLFMLNFGIGMRALKELQTTDRITSQHYEVSQWVRGIRLALFHLEIKALRHQAAQLEQVKLELEEALRGDSGAKVIQPALHARYDEIRSRIQGLLAGFTPDSSAVFRDPKIMTEAESIRGDLDGLVADSDALVRADRELNENLFRDTYPLMWTVFIASLFALIWRFFHFRRQVMTPLQSLVEFIDSYRKGDLASRWTSDRPDEIGHAERTLNQLLAELSQRRRERINFIGAVAHDINNPLTTIGMGCDLILRKREAISEEQVFAIVEKIKGQVVRLHHLTEDLLVAAKENRPVWSHKVSRFSLAGVAAAVVDLSRSSDPWHSYAIHVTEPHIELVADPDRITQVITNLISNAAKYSPKGTEIELVVGREKNRAFIEVRDRGVGIPEEKKASVFQAFSRLSSGMQMSGGTGLGLVIVKDIVESYSGKIRILDRKGGGTAFRVEIPDETLRGEKAPESRMSS